MTERTDTLKALLYKQIGLDYCCTEAEVKSLRNQFHVFTPLEGRRRFQQDENCFLRVCVMKNKLYFAGDERILAWCRKKFEDTDGAWFMESGTLRELDRKLAEYGYGIDFMHPFYVSYEPSAPEKCPYEIRYYRGAEIEAFRGDRRWANAFTFNPTAPDEIGVAALQDGKMIGMAGVSHDSPYMWQIGIDVLPEARGKGIGVTLVKLLKNEILKAGRIPYYGAAFSHTVSQNIAIRSGFHIAFVELTAERMTPKK